MQNKLNNNFERYGNLGFTDNSLPMLEPIPPKTTAEIKKLFKSYNPNPDLEVYRKRYIIP